MQKRIKIILLIIGIVLLGFVRDYFFHNVNWIVEVKYRGSANFARKEFHFLLDWTNAQIAYLKWGMTIFFTALFCFTTWFVIKIAFEKKEFNRITIYVYLGLFGISALLYALYAIFGDFWIYTVIRKIMGMAQSFLPLMFLAILFKFIPEIRKDKK